MAQRTLETTHEPVVVVENVGSDLQVKGWDRAEVLVKSSSDNQIVLEERDGEIIVSCPTDCVLYVPQKASLQVKNVASDARFRSVDGKITIGMVGRDLAMRDVGSVDADVIGTDFTARRIRNEVNINRIGASISMKDVGSVQVGTVGNQAIAKGVRGNFEAKQVGGSAIVRDIDGQVTFEGIGGTLHLRDVSGGITADMGGSATVDFSPVSWQAYSIQSAGNIRCHIPADANAELEITSGAERIRIKKADGMETFKENTHTITLGDGAAPVKLVAGGGVDVITQRGMDEVESFEFDFGEEISSLAEEIAEQTTHQIEAQMDMLDEQLNAQMAGLSASLGYSSMSEERLQELETRLEKAKERAAKRAEEAAKRAQVKMERKIAAAQRKAERKERTAAARQARKARKAHSRQGISAHDVVITPPPPPSQKEPVSEGERMMILQMLQEKKINVEQAEKLLAALEGN
jgi:hypothetical protein